MNCQASAQQAHTGNPRWLSKAVAVILLLSLSGCGYFQKKPDTNALCISECPDLTVLPDDTFGSTAKALADTANTYYNCRKACQTSKK